MNAFLTSPYVAKLATFALVILAGAIFSNRSSTAAEITCVYTWGDLYAPNELTQSSRLKDRFPSGRRPSPASCLTAMIKGTIDTGDSAKFAQLLQNNHPFLGTVLLWSSGGLVEEAMKIGRLVRKDILTTNAPFEATLPHPVGSGSLTDPRLALADVATMCDDSSCHCASACFLIWAAGIEREGNALGLHRPSIRSTSFADLPPERASGLYRLLLAEVERYLTEMEIPRRYIEIMTDTSSTDIRWLDLEEAWSLEEAPSVAEWIAAGCGAISKSERRAMLEIGAKLKNKINVSQQEKMLREQWLQRSSEIDECKAKRIDNSRDAITKINVK
jgi:hypothetical protein